MPEDTKAPPASPGLTPSTPPPPPAAPDARVLSEFIALQHKELAIRGTEAQVELARVGNEGKGQVHNKEIALASIDAEARDRLDERRHRFELARLALWATGGVTVAIVVVIWLMLHYGQASYIPLIISTLVGLGGGGGIGYAVGTQRERERKSKRDDGDEQ